MSARYFRLGAIGLAVLAATSCSSPNAPAELSADELAAGFGEFFDEQETRGFSGTILLAHAGTTLLHQSYGHAGCNGPAIQDGDVFLIGSIVKVFTKAAIYRLAADGRLSLDDSIAEHLPGVPADKQAITIRMLTQHRAGLADVVNEQGEPIPYHPDWDYLPVSKDEIVERGMRSTLIHAPGEGREYSNLGFSLLAAIIESAAGSSFEAAVSAAVFAPAGMNDTGYVLPDWSARNIVDGCYEQEAWPNPLTAGRWLDDGPAWNLRGNGGMLGTVADLHRWVNAVRGGGFLPPAVARDFLDSISGQSRTFKQRATVGAGGNGIFNAYYLWLIDSDLQLIMISNNGQHQVESYLDELFPRIAGFTGSEAVAPEGR